MEQQVKQMLNDMAENMDPPADWRRDRKAWVRHWLQMVADAANELRRESL